MKITKVQREALMLAEQNGSVWGGLCNKGFGHGSVVRVNGRVLTSLRDRGLLEQVPDDNWKGVITDAGRSALVANELALALRAKQGGGS